MRERMEPVDAVRAINRRQAAKLRRERALAELRKAEQALEVQRQLKQDMYARRGGG